jgi:excinuclease ABC subunit A
MPSEADFIQIRGAREHNLKNVALDIPKRKLVVFTGVSGSGKSSLAFDTLYAEGQRRYVESLSAYARQFLGQMEKPHFDTIRGLSPAISIEQKAQSNNPRSTVGTITEIHDYLRVLYARIGVQHCPQCGRVVGKQTAQQIVEEIRRLEAGEKLLLLAPLVRDRKGEHREILADALKRGFSRVRIDGTVHELGDAQSLHLDKKLKHDIELVVDRVVVKADMGQRLIDSVETALREGKGLMILAAASGDRKQDRIMSEALACVVDGISFSDLSPQMFSFNNPAGMCVECNGLGTRAEMDADLIVADPNLSIRGGAIAPWAGPLSRGEGWTVDMVSELSRAGKIDLDRPWRELPKAKRDLVLFGGGDIDIEFRWMEEGETRRYRRAWEGLLPMMMRRLKSTASEGMRHYYQRYLSHKPCPACGGARLNPVSRAVKVGGLSIDALCARTIGEAQQFLATLPLKGNERQVADELLKEIRSRLGFLLDVGLGYLTLDRGGPSLSGGEAQRIRLASQIGSELTGVIYILDEPSIGLHQRDNGKLLNTLQRLRDLGNTVVVVEHDRETMEASDWLVDFGPGAGVLGGEIVAADTPEHVAQDPRSLTGQYLSGRKSIPLPGRRRPIGKARLAVRGAVENNLHGLDVEFPLGVMTAVTGVSGAGKSTLVNEILYPAVARTLMGASTTPGKHRAVEGIGWLDKVIDIDQQPIGRTPRSNPATYTKVFDHIRTLFAGTPEARAFGYGPGRFSFNVKGGRCESCGGDGVKLVEMHFLADVYVTCEVCQGRRFNDATLRVRYKDKNIAEVLELSVHEAMALFSVHREIMRVLKTLDDVGLGYLKLGQPSPQLSGGEAQRIKLSRELARTATGRTLYILDEPTTGLHFDDVRKLLLVLDRLVEAGNSVLVIEHNLDVIKCADWVIDLGPEGGAAGGQIVAEGTPEEVAKVKDSYTGQYLKGVLRQPQKNGRASVAQAALG